MTAADRDPPSSFLASIVRSRDYGKQAADLADV